VGGVIRIVVAVVGLSSLLLLLLMLFVSRPAPTLVVMAGLERGTPPVAIEPERAPPVAVEPEHTPPVEPEHVMPVERTTKVERVDVVPVQPVEEPIDEPRPKLVNDFCARYGLHKVVTHGGRSWRCQK
jgi:hypothetical protein